jgi:hypothetical protein
LQGAKLKIETLEDALTEISHFNPIDMDLEAIEDN